MADFIASSKFQYMIRVRNTNIDGKRKVMFAFTAIQGIGRRLANLLCKKAEIDLNQRAGNLTNEDIDKIMGILSNPRQFKIPDWFLNRRKDIRDGKTSQITSNDLMTKLREDIEGLKKIRAHRGLRHYWGLRVRGQHTKTTGRGARVMAGQPSKKSK